MTNSFASIDMRGMGALLKTSQVPLSSFIVAVIVASTFSFTAFYISRRHLHPLSKFPGPVFNSLSELPVALSLLRGDQHVYFQQLHDRYGEVVRVGPNELSYIDPDGWTDIYGARKDIQGGSMEKGKIFIGAVSNTKGQTGISMADNSNHRRQRRALAYPFSNSALLQQESIIQKHVDKLMVSLLAHANAGKPVNMADWFTFTTFDLIGDLAFAEPFGCLDMGAKTEWATSVINVFHSASWLQAMRRVGGIDTLLQRALVWFLMPSNAAKWRTVHLANSQEKTLARLAAGTGLNHKDVIYHIQKNAESSKGLTESEIIMNMVLLISAGSETTAGLLTSWALYICTHPAVYDRLAAEIRGSFKSTDDISWATVTDRLPYLDATIQEALRLSSPAPTNIMREVPPGGATITGQWVAPGTIVGVAPWVATHSPLNFADPYDFVPERWLPDKDARYAADRPHASQPFNVGPRSCIGKHLAYLEMRLIMSHTLYNFDLALNGKREDVLRDWDPRTMKTFQTWMKPDLWINVTPV